MMKMHRRSLPLHGDWQTGSYATCTYKCNDHCHKDAPNEGAADSFGEIAERAISRRKLVKGAAVVGLVAGFAGVLDISTAERSLAQDGSRIGFTPGAAEHRRTPSRCLMATPGGRSCAGAIRSCRAPAV